MATLRLLFSALILGSFLSPVAALADFSDDFNRPASPTLDNGWVAKTATVWSLDSTQVPKRRVTTNYRDNVMYRPAAENLLDAEASLEFQLSGTTPGYPQLWTRIQTGTIATTNYADAYVLLVNDNTTQLILGRQRGAAFVVTLATLSLSSPLNMVDRYRLRLSATGVGAVLVQGQVERLDGGTWTLIGSASATDTASNRIDAAGSAGFTGNKESGYAFDNFSVRNIGVPPGPAPVVSDLSPQTAMAGESGLLLTVTGSNFAANSVVRWNGADRGTTFVSGTILEAAITAADLASAGMATVSVFNPAPGGGISNGLVFTIEPNPNANPVPTLSSLEPAAVTAGSPDLSLQVLGSGFATNAVVRWNGANRATTFVSPGELRAAIPAADLAVAGSANVTVFNPAPGGGVSAIRAFTIDPPPNPLPATSGLSPASAVSGGPGFTLSVLGSDFTTGSVVHWNGANRTTTFVSTGELRATIAAADISVAGTAGVTVFTPAPGGGTSNAQNFTINPSAPGSSAPVITSTNPQSAFRGAGGATVTLFGSGFVSGAVVLWNGNPRATTFVSTGELGANLLSGDLAAVGSGALAVRNPSGTLSSPHAFFVVDSGQAFFRDTFSRPDSPDVGNSWAEKTPSTWSLVGGELRAGFSSYYADAITTRPLSEDRRDVEISTEFRRLPRDGNSGFTQLHARAQRNTLGQQETIESYLFYINDFPENFPGFASISVQAPLPGVYECDLLEIPFPSPLQEGARYRLRLRVTGVAPVVLTGYIDRFEAGKWVNFISGTTTHDSSTQRNPSWYCDPGFMPAPITNAGAMGFAKWRTAADALDNFYWMDADGNNRLPEVAQLLPASAIAGAGAFTLEVRGFEFTAGSVVRWNGANRPTTFVSPTVLQAQITAADIATAGNAAVSVFTPAPGGGTSASMTFAVNESGGVFFDDFARDDSAFMGNAWLEESPGSFSIAAGRAAKNYTNSIYRDNALYRPPSENLLDTESSAEFRFDAAGPGNALLLSRIQTDTVLQYRKLDAYLLYFQGSLSQAFIGRQRGGSSIAQLTSITLAEPLNTVNNYRLRLRVAGTSPVQLTGTIERQSGGSWLVIGQGSFADSASSRIITPGSVGLGGNRETGYSFDNFTRTDLEN